MRHTLNPQTTPHCTLCAQVGLAGTCYPDSLISTLPNLYYYAANNPSEATIAKRRSYANTISYLTPPAENAGLYKGLKVCVCARVCVCRGGHVCACGLVPYPALLRCSHPSLRPPPLAHPPTPSPPLRRS